jgi:hypothetical protein
MSDAFQRELAFLGIESSPAFVRVPEGNGCAERFIRTLKENLLWLRAFDTVEELRQALLVFRELYNTTWLIERHGFHTPAAVRVAARPITGSVLRRMEHGPHERLFLKVGQPKYVRLSGDPPSLLELLTKIHFGGGNSREFQLPQLIRETRFDARENGQFCIYSRSKH